MVRVQDPPHAAAQDAAGRQQRGRRLRLRRLLRREQEAGAAAPPGLRYCTVLYCTVHHLDSGTVLLLVVGPCSLLLLVYILVMLCRSGVFTLSIGEWPLAITVTWGLERLHCTALHCLECQVLAEQSIILLPLYLCLDFDLGLSKN